MTIKALKLPVALISNRWLRGWFSLVIPARRTRTRWRFAEFRSAVCSPNTRQQGGGSQHLQRPHFKAWLCPPEVRLYQLFGSYFFALPFLPSVQSFSCHLSLEIRNQKRIKHTRTILMFGMITPSFVLVSSFCCFIAINSGNKGVELFAKQQQCLVKTIESRAKCDLHCDSLIYCCALWYIFQVFIRTGQFASYRRSWG